MGSTPTFGTSPTNAASTLLGPLGRAGFRAPRATAYPAADSAAARSRALEYQMSLANILWTVLVIVVVLWLLGFVLNVGGGLIHVLLIVALIIVLYNLLTGRRTI